MKFYEIKINLALKAPIHFQKSPEAISKMIATALINSGYSEHYKNKPKNYVFSNLGKANEKGFFEKEGIVYFRTFKEDLAQKLANSMFFYEDNIFKTKSLKFQEVKYKKIESVMSVNPVFVVMKKNNKFWTYQESDGDLTILMNALQDNLIRKYEDIFKEKIKPKLGFMEYFEIKNYKPQTFFYKGSKFFGNKIYFKPRDDEASQKLAFMSIGAGLGHKNSSVGGGFVKWQTENGKWYI